MAFNKEQFIEDLKAMSVLELKEVVEAIEETFGVSAQPVAVAGGAAAGAAAEEKTEEKTAETTTEKTEAPADGAQQQEAK